MHQCTVRALILQLNRVDGAVYILKKSAKTSIFNSCIPTNFSGFSVQASKEEEEEVTCIYSAFA